MLGKEDWWWIMDDVQEAFGAQLLRDGHLVIDGFLPEGHVTQLRSEVVACHEAGHLHVAGLVDSSINSVSAAKYENTQTRGDVIGWFDSDEQGWPYGRGLHNYLVKVGTMLSELGAHVPELKQITSRSKVMVACYPGGGARYVKHVDNDGKHPLCRTRLLTGLLYLNPEWKPGDGGELAIYEQSDKNVERRVVQPRGNRLLLFWSDWRTPHEVRPAQQPRYAVTLWFLHKCTDLRWAEEEELPAPVPAPASEAPSLDAASGDVTGTATPGVHTCGSGTDTTAAWATSPVDDGPGDSNNDDGKSDGGGGTVGRGHTGAHCEQLVQPAGDMVRHCWRRLEVQGGQLNDGAGRWELRVEVPGERPGCPVLEVSDSHVSVSSSSGAPLAQLPLPAGRWEASGSTWSRKRGLLATTFEALPTTPASSSTAAAPVAGPGDAGSAAAAAAEKAAAAAPCTRGRAAPVRHGWLRLGDAGGRESESAWELRVEVPGECPVLEVSEAQVCVASPGGRPLLRVPLPRGSWGPPANKWSRRRGLLTSAFQPLQLSARGADSDSAALLAARLTERGWGFIDAFLSGPEADALRGCVLQLRQSGRLRVGSNGHEGATGYGVKNDEYAFLDPAEVKEALAKPLRECAGLCNRLVLALVRAVPALQGLRLTAGQPMVAVYPGDGARYGRHYDATAGKVGGDNGRVVTLVVYLNPFWREEDGGALRIFEPEGVSEQDAPVVQPLHGRLVGFLCKDRCPHEVLPSRADRAAVTFWYYDGDRLAERCRDVGADGEGLRGFGFEMG